MSAKELRDGLDKADLLDSSSGANPTSWKRDRGIERAVRDTQEKRGRYGGDAGAGGAPRGGRDSGRDLRGEGRGGGRAVLWIAIHTGACWVHLSHAALDHNAPTISYGDAYWALAQQVVVHAPITVSLYVKA